MSKTPDSQLSTINQEPTVGAMMQLIIEKGITGDSVTAMEKLCDLKIKLDDREAEKEFNRAFVLLQSEMSSVQATKIVPNKDGSPRYAFAPYEELMKAVKPMLEKHGFCVTFDMEFIEGGRIKSICSLIHTGGHSRKNSFAVRIGGGPPGSNETQADGAAKTYARRGALCDALNIVVTQDTDGDDGRGEGKPIMASEAAELKDRVKKLGADEGKFLALAQAANYESITENQLSMLHESLDSFEKKIKAKKDAQNLKDAPDQLW